MNIYEKYLNVKNEIGSIQKTALNPFHKAKYAPLSEIQKHVNPILFKNKLVMTWNVTKKELESETWTFHVGLIDVEKPESELNFSFDTLPDTNNKNAIQGWGSTITYAKRYIYGIIFEIAFDDEDPDAKNGHNGDPKEQLIQSSKAKIESIVKNDVKYLTSDQLHIIKSKLEEKQIDPEMMKKYIAKFGWTRDKIPANKFDIIIKSIEHGLLEETA